MTLCIYAALGMRTWAAFGSVLVANPNDVAVDRPSDTSLSLNP